MLRIARILVVLVFAAAGVLLAVAFAASPSRQQLVAGHPLKYWLDCLESDDVQLRAGAVTSLPQFGIDAVNPLIARLDDPSPACIAGATAAIKTIGPAAVPQLGAALQSASPQRRVALIGLLTGMGGASAPAAGQIAGLIGDPQAGRAAADYFVKLRPSKEAIDAALRVLSAGDRSTALDAIRILGRAAPDPLITEALMQAGRSHDPAIHDAALNALCDISPPPPEAINLLIFELHDIRHVGRARMALRRLGPPAAPALAAMAKLSADEAARLSAVAVLTTILASRGGDLRSVESFVRNDESESDVLARRAIAFIRTRRASTEEERKAVASLFAAPFRFSATPPPIQTAQAKQTVAAITVLSTKTPAPTTMPTLVIDALDDDDASVRDLAEKTIRSMLSAAVPYPAYSGSVSPIERARCVRMLPFSTDPRRYDELLVSAGDITMIDTVIRAMGRSLDDPRIVSALLASVRLESVKAPRIQSLHALAPVREQPEVTLTLLNLARKGSFHEDAEKATEILESTNP